MLDCSLDTYLDIVDDTDALAGIGDDALLWIDALLSTLKDVLVWGVDPLLFIS